MISLPHQFNTLHSLLAIHRPPITLHFPRAGGRAFGPLSASNSSAGSTIPHRRDGFGPSVHIHLLTSLVANADFAS